MRRCLSRSYFSKCLIKGITKARWEAWCAAGLLVAHWPQTRGLIWTLCEELSGDREQINPHWVDDSCPSREMKSPSGSLPQRCPACGLEPGSLICICVKVRLDGQMDNAHHGVCHKKVHPNPYLEQCVPLQRKYVDRLVSDFLCGGINQRWFKPSKSLSQIGLTFKIES